MYPYDTGMLLNTGPRPWETPEGVWEIPGGVRRDENSFGAGSWEPIALFQGEEYATIVVFGWFGSKALKSVGHFASNAVKTAGRAIGTVSHGIQDVGGLVGKGLGKIPIVGGPLHTVFDAGFHLAMAPTNLAVAVVIEGRRIDKAVLDNIKQQLHEFKQVAPYAQMVISVIPGIGQGVSACLSAGLALAEGQSITDVLKAGLIGAMPGGPLVKAAVTMSVETIQHVARGDKLNLQTLGQTAGGVASSALGIPLAAKNALVIGVGIIGNVAKGNPFDKAVTDGAIKALPLSDQVKKALTEASTLSLDIAHGKKIDAAFTARINTVASMLPPTNPLADSIKTGLTATRKVVGKNEQIMLTALQSGLGDTLVSMGAQPLPPDAQKAIKSGVAVGSGVVYQGNRKVAIGKVTGKLIESGVQLSKTSPVFAEARKLAATKGATQGFDHATGLLQQKIGVFDLATVRNGMNPTQKIGFDMAISLRIGVVANPKPPTISPAAQAGHAITLGMQSYVPERKAVLMQTIQSNPSATVGATVAIKEVVATRESFIVRLLKALGIRK